MAGIFKYISEWISGNFPSDEETHRESMRSAKEAKARGSASHVEHIIDIFEDEVCDRYPGRTDIITAVKKFRQALYDEHGGISPYSMLNRSKHFTPEGKIAFDKVVERCSDRTKLSKEFAFLKGYSPSGERISVWSLYPIASMYDTEAHAVDTALGMQQWHVDKYGTPLD
ncbi:hypothetical protein TESG_08212 [Trichophyton tonsurans CBS 112818]|uniref:Uncharacterized protein n=2 Tax=Trichophyton TaxID=5550 RepID=F2PM99_TRIEC|nr:hypothetical protein TESG_08212 [Trichophyton tonsurans CBS 112818]EGE02996.1 hypothetical protein TEQG_02033 [Trichophyton equinum CBS 127.97]